MTINMMAKALFDSAVEVYGCSHPMTDQVAVLWTSLIRVQGQRAVANLILVRTASRSRKTTIGRFISQICAVEGSLRVIITKCNSRVESSPERRSPRRARRRFLELLLGRDKHLPTIEKLMAKMDSLNLHFTDTIEPMGRLG
jgi:hypothetical protein